jgi:triphosphoribosyl-dephospho-CoA synthase
VPESQVDARRGPASVTADVATDTAANAAARRARAAFLWACELDVAARKPGNVSAASAGHGMEAALFVASARAAAPALCRPGARVGGRIEQAVRATREVAGCNTNLGIVLLCAPLAAAAERGAGESVRALRHAVEAVLEDLDLADSAAAFRAIVLAAPAGLGSAAEQDVSAPPSVGLRAAMALAAGRDHVARQYAQGFADLFDPALAWFVSGGRRTGTFDPVRAIQRVYLESLARWPDSHIVRKHGPAASHTVMQEAQAWARRARVHADLDADPAFAGWDESLKQRGLNPGTSADVAVAVAMLHALLFPASAVETRLAWKV